MSNTTLRRYLVVGVLVAVLAAAGAAPANARDLSTAGSAWLWLQDVWTQGIYALWGWHSPEPAGPRRTSGWVPIVAKEGLGLDPNGSPRTNSSSAGCGTDQCGPINPNG